MTPSFNCIIMDIREAIEYAKCISEKRCKVPIGQALCIRQPAIDCVTVRDAIALAHIVHLFRFVAICQGVRCEVVESHDPNAQVGLVFYLNS